MHWDCRAAQVPALLHLMSMSEPGLQYATLPITMNGKRLQNCMGVGLTE